MINGQYLEVEGYWHLHADGHPGWLRGPLELEACLQTAAEDSVGTFLFPFVDHDVTEKLTFRGGKFEEARDQLTAGQHAPAVQAYQAIVDEKPGKHASLFELAMAQYASGDNAAAQETMVAVRDAKSNAYYRYMSEWLEREVAARRTLEVPEAMPGTTYATGDLSCVVASATAVSAASDEAVEVPDGAVEIGVPPVPEANDLCTSWGDVECCLPPPPEDDNAP